jgi:hypothetical protein
MQPTKLLPDAAGAELDDAEDDELVVLGDEALDELEPHAAMSKLAAAAATAVMNAVCFTVPPLDQVCRVPRPHGAPPEPRLPERVKLVNAGWEEARHSAARSLPNRDQTGSAGWT